MQSVLNEKIDIYRIHICGKGNIEITRTYHVRQFTTISWDLKNADIRRIEDCGRLPGTPPVLRRARSPPRYQSALCHEYMTRSPGTVLQHTQISPLAHPNNKGWPVPLNSTFLLSTTDKRAGFTLFFDKPKELFVNIGNNLRSYFR